MKICGWGRYPIIQADSYAFETPSQLEKILLDSASYIPRGMGRSYGDSALSKKVVSSLRFDKIHDFDPDSGTVTCESGVSLAELQDVFIPKGWFLPVTPGTKFITVGGAIAGDVHGKNHHTSGCFSQWVISFDLMLPEGQVIACSNTENRELFMATCGGMGLSGVILAATIQLKPVKSATIVETVARCENLAEVFFLFEEYRHMTYSMAWIDCLAKNEHIGRSVIMAGEFAETGDLQPPPVKPSLTMPADLPGFCLNKYSVSMFNFLYYRKYPRHKQGRHTPLDTFFYPLDAIGHWNRLYGKSGFTQYQFVLPKASSAEGLKIILRAIADKGMGFLGVLKLFGPKNENLLSFPMEGYTMALDFKIENRLFPFLKKLDKIVVDLGGRLYLSKDVRMDRDVFLMGYPNWEQFAQVREKWRLKNKFNSLQSKRLGI